MQKDSAKQLGAVTIPIYKALPNENEVFSLNQCCNVLTRYPIIFFAPYSLNVSFYENYCRDRVSFTIIRFNDTFFRGISDYNKLMLSKQFYDAFNKFKYILIYQLDAFVFKDELLIWCNKGYDYIGAPYIFVDLDTYPIKVFTRYRWLLKRLNKAGLLNYTFRHVGNGGLSLRHVGHCSRLISLLKKQVLKWQHNEDSFFVHYGNLLFLLFKIAPEKEALQFAFEEKPDQAYQINNNQLPFGCHAYIKHNDKDFWASIFKTIN